MWIFFKFSYDQNENKFPEFWSIIEERMNYKPPDIFNVKQILTILGFTTLQSISSLSNRTKMETLELEFFKLKETGQISTKKHLMDEKFAMGTKAIINAISNQIKRGFFSEEKVDTNATLKRIFDECKAVS